MRANDLRTYSEFWPYYLREHSKPKTRAIHFAGTGCAIALLGAAVWTANPWLAGAALLAGYGPAWYAHAAVEKNRPATFRFPLWSLISDFRMSGLWCVGRLEAELAKAGIPPNRG